MPFGILFEWLNSKSDTVKVTPTLVTSAATCIFNCYKNAFMFSGSIELHVNEEITGYTDLISGFPRTAKLSGNYEFVLTKSDSSKYVNCVLKDDGALSLRSKSITAGVWFADINYFY